MGQAEWGLVVALGGMFGVVALAQRLVWSIWVGRYPRPVHIGAPLVLAVLAIMLLATGSPSTEPTLIAGVVAQESPCHAAGGGGLHLAQRGERATIAGAPAAVDCAIWAVAEDPRTGAYWLQGPAQTDETSWSLDLVIGPGTASTEPLPYRVTVFAVSMETSAAWQAAARGEAQLTLGSLPPAQTWLGGAITVDASPRI